MEENQDIEQINFDKKIHDNLSKGIVSTNELRKKTINHIYNKIINLEIYIDQANISLESIERLEYLHQLGTYLILNIKKDRKIIRKLKSKLKHSYDYVTCNDINLLLSILDCKYEYILETYSNNYYYAVEKVFNTNCDGFYIDMVNEIIDYSEETKKVSLNLHL